MQFNAKNTLTSWNLGPVIQNLTMSLVNETLKFQTYYAQKHYHLLPKKSWGAFTESKCA